MGHQQPQQIQPQEPPDSVRSNETAKYCWTHGHDTRHNSNECTAQCVGHKTNATTHVNMGGNPKNLKRSIAPSNLVVTGVDICARGQTQQIPSWNQQANMGYCMPPQQPMMTQQPMLQHPMIQQPMIQQPQYAGMIMPNQQFIGDHNQHFNRTS